MLIAVIGLPGSGKTEAVKFFENKGFRKIYFGDITFDMLRRKKLEINEKNERKIREQLRREYGMAAYAKLNLPKIEKALKKNNVVIESMYSLEEYLLLKEHYPELIVIAIYASPKTRHTRLAERKQRPLTPKECISRDLAQIQKLHQAGPIALADYTIINETSLEDLHNNLNKIFRRLTA